MTSGENVAGSQKCLGVSYFLFIKTAKKRKRKISKFLSVVIFTQLF